MASSGPNNPSSASNDSSVGSTLWVNPSLIYANDGSGATSSKFSSLFTYYIKATGFGFSIPDGATIDGIEMVMRRQSLPSTANDTKVNIIKGGTISTTNLASATSWGASYNSKTYGGPTELWGETWTASDINSANFGVACASQNTAFSKGGHVNYIDNITITVYYTEGATTAISNIGGVSYSNTKSVSTVPKSAISQVINIT